MILEIRKASALTARIKSVLDRNGRNLAISSLTCSQMSLSVRFACIAVYLNKGCHFFK